MEKQNHNASPNYEIHPHLAKAVDMAVAACRTFEPETITVEEWQRLLEASEEYCYAYLGVTPRTLEVWRSVKRHAIPYIKVGRLVKYRRDDLDTWLSSRTVGSSR